MKRNWLKNKTVVITGASGGIGFGIAKALIEKFDCKILGIARSESKFISSIATLSKPENFSYYTFDVNSSEGWHAFIEDITAKGLSPDVIINNAGFMLPFDKLENYTDNEVEDILNTNFISVVKATRYMLPIIKKSKTPAIINISSSAGLCAVVGESLYCATKFAVRGFTETLIQDYKNSVYVAGVYPGFIKTDILGRMSTEDKENKLINKMMMPLPKAIKKIVRGISKGKRRIVTGLDGKSLSFFGKHFGVKGPGLVSFVLRKSKLDCFKRVFEKEEN